MSVWQTILLALLGNTAALAVLGFLFKSIVSHSLSRDLAQYKSELEHNSAEALAEVRHTFELLATEHRVRFSKLHEDRAQAIAELHGMLVDVYRSSMSFASIAEWSGEPDKATKFAAAATQLHECYMFFEKKRIFLPEHTCASVEGILNTVFGKVSNFGSYLQMPALTATKDGQIRKDEAWSEAWRFFREEFPNVRAELESEFRHLLSGDEG